MVDVKDLSIIKTNMGESLSSLSRIQPILLVFLRRFGCIFCREALKDIKNNQEFFDIASTKVVMVHMSEESEAEQYFDDYGLSGISHISDPNCKLYAKFGLIKGSFSQLYGLKTWIRGFEVIASSSIKPTLNQVGDGFQMPGIFLISNDRIKEQYIHKSVSDRPNYRDLVQCCTDI